jgi:phosphoribosylformylglycinamidine synthase
VADEATLTQLESGNRVVFRYVAPDGASVGAASPNGSMRDVAGIVNPAGNVLGMMPHPERACEALLGSSDGMRLFASVAESIERHGAPMALASA